MKREREGGKQKDAERNWKALLSEKQRDKGVNEQKEIQKEKDGVCEGQN